MSRHSASPPVAPPFDLHILCRLSVAESEDGESLEAQVDQAKRDAAQVLATDLDRITFVSGPNTDRPPGPSGPVVKVSACYISGGSSWDERRDLQDVLDDARQGRCTAVLTPNLDRVARNVEVAERFRRELLAAGVRTMYEGRAPHDLADDNQVFMYGMRAQFSAYERAVITRRNFSGHIRAAREGFYVGGNIPFGTTLEATGLRSKSRRYRMCLDSEEMDVVRELFARRAAGWSLDALCDWTRDIGVMPNPHHYRSSGPGLSRTHIEYILKNDFYVSGDFRFTVTAPRWGREVVVQHFEIPDPVSRDLFDQLAAARARRTGDRQDTGAYLLAGLVVHRESGTAFRSATTKTSRRRHFYYYNPAWGAARRRLYVQGKLDAAALTPSGANHPVYSSISREALHQLVLEELARLAQKPDLIAELVEAEDARRASDSSGERSAHLRKLADVDEAQAAVERFLEAFATGVLPMTPETTRKHRDLQARVRALETEAAQLRSAKRANRDVPNRAEAIRAALAAFPERLSVAPMRQRRALVQALVSRVWVDDLGGVTIDLALG